MKSPEEMAAYFKSMPKKEKSNPYWESTDTPEGFINVKAPEDFKMPFDPNELKPLLIKVREYFRRYYESFWTEAQVLCVTLKDGEALSELGIPVLTTGTIGPFPVMVMVLPQENSRVNTRIDEGFWQNRIVGAGIHPIARIHSHYTLPPYQSITDYSTLNSGTMEIVIGHILEEPLSICYWLDVPGTDTKAKTFLAFEPGPGKPFQITPQRFHEGVEAVSKNKAIK